jgi:hypothetical protein
LTWKALQECELRISDFRRLYEVVFGQKTPKNLDNLFDKIKDVRNRIIHGKDVAEKDKRLAVGNIIDYAEGFNKFTYKQGKFLPLCGDLRGVMAGKKERLDKKRSRFILKGMGLPLA